MPRLLTSAVVLCLVSSPAAAEQPGAPAPPPADAPGRGDRFVAGLITELRREETFPRRTKLLGLHAGYHGDVAGMLELRVGWGKGTTKESFLFPTTNLWRVSLAARGAYGREDSVALSLLGGWSTVSLVGFSLEAGLDARVDPGDRNLGPVVTAGLRVGQLGLHLTSWTHVLEDEPDWGFSVALGVNLFDYKGASDVAKDRARDKLQEHVPVPLPGGRD